MIEVEFVEVHANNKVAQGFGLKTGQMRIHKVSETHSWTHSLKTSPQHTLFMDHKPLYKRREEKEICAVTLSSHI